MQWRLQYGFSILFPVEEAVWVFGENLKITRIAAVPHAHRQLCLILNLSEKTGEGTPIVNDTTDR